MRSPYFSPQRPAYCWAILWVFCSRFRCLANTRVPKTQRILPSVTFFMGPGNRKKACIDCEAHRKQIPPIRLFPRDPTKTRPTPIIIKAYPCDFEQKDAQTHNENMGMIAHSLVPCNACSPSAIIIHKHYPKTVIMIFPSRDAPLQPLHLAVERPQDLRHTTVLKDYLT